MNTILLALREPEAFAEHHHEAPTPALLLALVATASVGVGLYGGAMHAWSGAAAMGLNSLAAVAAAGVAWSVTLPSLYVLGSLTGSRLALRSLLLATLITVSFGGLAMLASIPVLWFFELCLPYGPVRLLTNLVVFAGVGMSMTDVFLRVMARLEGPRFFHWGWLSLLAVVGAEMFYVFGLFELMGGAA